MNLSTRLWRPLVAAALALTTWVGTASAQQQCADDDDRRTQVYFSNGILTQRAAAYWTSDALRAAYERTLELRDPGSDYEFGIAYNPTQGWFTDITQVLEQKMDEVGIVDDGLNAFQVYQWIQAGLSVEEIRELIALGVGVSNGSVLGAAITEVALEELAEALTEATAEALADRLSVNARNVTTLLDDLRTGRRVILVSHSQGNLFSNDAILTVERREPQFANSLAAIGVATPAATTIGGDRYVTADDDFVINALRVIETVLPSNVDNDPGIFGDFRSATNHLFGRDYFDRRLASRRLIDDEMIRLADRLAYPATVDCDRDADGLPDDWETAFGLDPDDPSDAASDLDCDGLIALDEFRTGSDPTLAEGGSICTAGSACVDGRCTQTCDDTVENCGDDQRPQAPLCEGPGCVSSNGNFGHSVGDPHLRTFDGMAYDFQGVGEYVLARSASGEIEIQSRTAPWRNRTDVSLNRAIAVRVGANRVGFYGSDDAELEVRVDGGAASLEAGATRLSGGGEVYRYGEVYSVTWPDGTLLRIKARGAFLDVEVAPAAARRGEMSGLLGDYDGEAANDLVSRDGAVRLTSRPSFAELYDVFGESWRIAQSDSLFDYAPDESTETFTDRDLPRRRTAASDLADADAIEGRRLCLRAGVVGDAELAACILDVAVTGDPGFATVHTRTAPTVMTLAVDRPPVVSILRPIQGAELGSNVLVSGVIDADDRIVAIGYSVNDGAIVDVPVQTNESGFRFSIPGQVFAPGRLPVETIEVFVTDDDGDVGSDEVTILHDPAIAAPSGGDLVVFNDANLFPDRTADGNDVAMVARNLVDYEIADGPRSDATRVLMDRGRASPCVLLPNNGVCDPPSNSIVRTAIEQAGYQVDDIESSAGDYANVDADVKVIFTWLPSVPFTAEEIEGLRRFAAEGGRIVVIGENSSVYTADGFATQNQLVAALGGQLTNVRVDIDRRSAISGANVGDHPIMEGVAQLSVDRFSVIEPGPNDFVLLREPVQGLPLAAVVAVDVTTGPGVAAATVAPPSAPLERVSVNRADPGFGG